MTLTHLVERLHPGRLDVVGDEPLDQRREPVRMIWRRRIEPVELRQALGECGRVALAGAAVALMLVAGPASAGNPSGTGQPNASCEDQALRDSMPSRGSRIAMR